MLSAIRSTDFCLPPRISNGYRGPFRPYQKLAPPLILPPPPGLHNFGDALIQWGELTVTFAIGRALYAFGHPDESLPTRRTKPTIDMVITAVTEHCGVSRAEILSKCRTQRVARPRQMVMYLCRRLSQKSLPEIARRLGGRDHTTVLCGQRRIAGLIQTDAKIRDAVASLSLVLTQSCQ